MNQIEIIQEHLDRATQEVWEEGKKWYEEAHEFCIELSIEFGVELEKVVGIMAALSVQKRWETNKNLTRRFLEGERNLHFGHQVQKAVAILGGMNPELALGGLKTINFYFNILNPFQPNWITIDRWIIRMFNETPCISPKKYQKLKQPFIDYSKGKDLVGCQYQAICWGVCRGSLN